MNKSQHKLKKQVCPACGESKEYPERQETCGSVCARLLKIRGAAEEIREDNESEISSQLRHLFLKSRHQLSIDDVADLLRVPVRAIWRGVEELRKSGKNVIALQHGLLIWSQHEREAEKHVIELSHSYSDYAGDWLKFGACGDQHLGSKYERLDVNEALYDIYANEGVTAVFNTGNWIEGEAGRMNYSDVAIFGVDDQIDYFIQNYPQRKGITTYFVAGDDHEGWYQKKGRLSIGKLAEYKAREAGRKDLVYLGYMEADISLKTRLGVSWLKVMHPGGGSAYAESYTCQKIAEAFQEGEKPHVCLVGHYHKMGYGFHRGIHMVQTGTGQDQSSFMRKQKIKAAVGGAMIHLHQAPTGEVNRFRPEFFPFYDRDFYTKKRQFDSCRKNPARDYAELLKAA
jgi:hypothetical protein